ncbi:MAG TPA: hypothetical protein VLT45_16115, partial [Kofleriaceae bacterium]|nr:hypothetical protein [Kofleriaceae bacterium]
MGTGADERRERGGVAVRGLQVRGLGGERVELRGGRAGRVEDTGDEQARAAFVGDGVGTAGEAGRDGRARGGRITVDPLQKCERGAAERPARWAGLVERARVELLCADVVTFEREDLREAGERVLAFGEAEGFFGGGGGFVEAARGGEGRRVDGDGVGLAREGVAVERADAEGFGGLVEIEQDRGVVIVDATAELFGGGREERTVLVAGKRVVAGALVELGDPERELAIGGGVGGEEGVASRGGA